MEADKIINQLNISNFEDKFNELYKSLSKLGWKVESFKINLKSETAIPLIKDIDLKLTPVNKLDAAETSDGWVYLAPPTPGHLSQNQCVVPAPQVLEQHETKSTIDVYCRHDDR